MCDACVCVHVCVCARQGGGKGGWAGKGGLAQVRVALLEELHRTAEQLVQLPVLCVREVAGPVPAQVGGQQAEPEARDAMPRADPAWPPAAAVDALLDRVVAHWKRALWGLG